GTLATGESIYSAKRLNIPGSEPAVLDLLGTLPCYVHLRDQSLERRLRAKYGSLRAAAEALGLNYPRWTDASHKRCVMPAELRRIGDDLGIGPADLSALIESVSVGKRGRLRLGPEFTWAKFLYLLGLVASDGTVYENHAQHVYYVMFSNEEPVLLAEFERLVAEIFAGTPIQRHLNQDGVTMLRINSLPLVTLAKALGIDADFSPVMRLGSELVASFLRGYFDGDGSVNARDYRV